MSAPKILVISNTPFFGGGEAFIVDTLVHLREPLYYLVRNTTLADSLPADRVFRFSKTSFAGQLSEVRRVIAGLDPDCVIFNGGRTLFLFHGCAPNGRFFTGIRRFCVSETD